MIRRREWIAWAAVAGMATTAMAPWTPRLDGKAWAAARSLMPWSALSAIPVAAGAALTGRRALAATATAVATAGVAMAAPLVVPRAQPAGDPAAAPLRISHTNLLYVNRRVAAVPDVLRRLDADVVTFSELTPTHVRRLRSTSLAATYPHQVEMAGPAAIGTGLWSRYPITVGAAVDTTLHTIVADVDAPGGPVRVIVIHTRSPISNHRDWVRDLDVLGEVPTTGPAVMTGDFNASWWHPQMRRMMRTGGWRDAHQLLGRGLSCSWPTDQWHPVFRWHPPFVRIDHALVNGGVRVLATEDFDVPGSDHRGILVTVQRAVPAAP